MKLSCFLLFFVVFAASANESVLAQKVDLNFRNADIRDVFRSIREQTGHVVIYSFDKVEAQNARVSIHMDGAQLSEALDALLRDLPYTYTIEDQSVLIIPAPEKAVQQPVQVTVRGRVTDANSHPLTGVTVIIPGTTHGVATDANGEYVLRFPRRDGAVIRFSFIGKKDVEVPYTGQPTIEVNLEDAVSAIDQVVVTGYQNIAREKVTGAVTTITADELGDRYTPNLLDNLEGRVAGLMVYNGGMQIRGTGSIHAERNPLLVIDGMPMEGSIDDLNPYDIESITVLKDAAAAAIYGARASNGIIVITTKQAARTSDGSGKPGKIEVDVSANFTVYEKRNLDYHDNFYMNAAEQVDMEMKTWESYFFVDPTTTPTAISNTQNSIDRGYFASTTPIQYAYYQLATGAITRDQLNTLMDQYKQNDFAKEYGDKVLKNRFLQQYNVSLRNRTENFSSSLVLNYRRDNAGIIESYNDRFSAFYKAGYDMAKWVSVRFGAEIAFNKAKESNSEYATNPFNVPAYMNLLNADGSYNYYSASLSDIYHTQWEDEPGLLFNGFNHLEEMNYDKTLTKRLSARLQGELMFRILDGLTLNTQFIYEADRRNESSYSEAESYVMRMMRNAYTEKVSDGVYTYLVPEHGGKMATRDTRGDYWTARAQVNFNRTFGRHTIDFLAGLEFRQTYSKGTTGLMLGYDDTLQSQSTMSVDYPYLENNYTYSTFYGSNYPARQFFYSPFMASAIGPVREEMHRYASGYANITYTYDNRYNLFASFRSDYADVYGLDTEFRGKPLWSVGASWNINREEFMGGIEWVDMLKLRLSYGVTGNIYQGATSFMTATTGTINSLTGQPISKVVSPANPELKWEQTATTNIGLDFALLGNRLRGSVDWYYKKGTDIFANKLLEDSKGFASMAMNAASLRNNGIEVVLSGDWFRAYTPGGFSWTTSATFAYNKNEITEVDTPATRAYELIDTPYKVGYPVSAIFTLPYAGISESGNEFLYWKNATTKSTSIWSESPDVAIFAGQSDPKVSIGMENRFRFKNFSLNVMMVYYGGHKMRMRQIGLGAKYSLPYGTIDKAYVDSWTPENKDTQVPGYGQYGGSYTSSEYQSLDIYVHKGNFLKIRNIVVGYDLPRTLLSKIGLSNASLRFQIDNPRPLYIANDVGVDPETNGLRKQTSYIFGLNISF